MKSISIFIILVGLILLTFGSVVGHGFIGDDHLLFVNNDFYANPSNLRLLWSKDFITTPKQLQEQPLFGPTRSFSGCVTFRPVTALSFFLDAFIWQGRPAGYHFSTLLIHLCVAWAVWGLLCQLGLSLPAAGLAAALFVVHPVQAEVVNNIGYRSDLLLGLFVILSLSCWIRCLHCLKNNQPTERWKFWLWGAAGLVTFAGALLSKEVAVGLPFLVAAYFIFVAPKGEGEGRLSPKGLMAITLSLSLVLLAYLFVYFIAFPSGTPVNWSNVHVGVQVRQALRILYYYGTACVWPWRLTLLPSFYALPANTVPWHEILWLSLAGLLALWTVIQGLRRREKYGLVTFFVVWVGVTYAPSANGWPLPSPMAYRYLYLPLVGGCALLALAVNAGLQFFLQRNKISPLTFRLLCVGFIGIFVAASLPLNIYYRDDKTINLALIQQYPDSAYPYLLLGSDNHRERRYPQAVAALKQYLNNRPASTATAYDLLPPRHEIYVQLGTCYIDDPDQALKHFNHALKLKPDYPLAYAQMAWALAHKKDYAAALHYCHKALKIDPDLFIGYFYAIQLYNFTGDMDSSNVMLDRAKGKFPHAPWQDFFVTEEDVSEINVRGQRLRKL